MLYIIKIRYSQILSVPFLDSFTYTVFMITQELLSYIKSQHEQGIPQEQVVAALRGNGWMEDDINNAFNTLFPQPIVTAAPIIEPVIQTMPAQEIVQPVQPIVQAESIQEMRPMMAQSFVEPVTTQQPVQPLQSVMQESVIMQQPAMMQAQPMQSMQFSQPIAQAQPGMQTMPMQSYNTMNTIEPVMVARKSRMPLLIGVIAILVLLVGGLSYAYYAGYFTPLEKTTAQAFESMYSAKSASFDVTATIDVSGASKMTTEGLATFSGGVPVSKVSVTAKGMYDLSDVNNQKISTTISIGAGSANIDAELRYLNKTVYAQLTKIPAATLIPTLSSFTNKWIALPPDGDTGALSDTPLASLPGIDSKIFSSLTTEQKTHLYDLAKNSHFITVTKKESPESINGKLAYHFYFDLDKKGITEYLNQAESYIHEVGKNDSRLSSFDAASGIKQLETIQNFVGEAWIGKTDKLLAKTDIKFSVVTMNNNEASTTKVSIIGIFDKWNEPVTVAAPESSKTLDEIMKDMIADIEDGTSSDPLIQASFDAADAKAEEAKLKSMVTNTRASAELYYDKSKSYSGFCDSKEYQKASEITCVSSKTGFFAITPQSNGKFFCADATGFAGEVSTEPKTGFACPKK